MSQPTPNPVTPAPVETPRPTKLETPEPTPRPTARPQTPAPIDIGTEEPVKLQI